MIKGMRVLACSLAVAVGLIVGASPVAAQQKTLTVWWTESDPNAQKAMERVVAEYEKLHPNVKVKVEAIGWGALFQKLVAGIAAGAPPDLTHLQPFMIDSLYRKGQLLPITDVIKALGENDVYEPVKLAQKYGEDYYGISHALGTSAWNYRSDFFKEKGLKTPTTWDELLRAAAALNTPERAGITLVGEPYFMGSVLGELVVNNGGRWVDPVTFKPAFTDKPFVEALRFYGDLAKYAQKGWANQKYLDSFVLYATGKTAIYPSLAWARSHLWIKRYAKPEQANPATFVAAFPPTGPSLPKGSKATVLYDAEPWTIIKGARNVAEAKDFLKVYYRKDVYKDVTLSVPMHMAPVLKSVAEDYARTPQVKEWSPWFDLTLTALRENRAVPFFMSSASERVPFMLELEGSRVIGDMVLDVTLEGKTPEEAAARGQKRAEELIAKMGWKRW